MFIELVHQRTSSLQRSEISVGAAHYAPSELRRCLVNRRSINIWSLRDGKLTTTYCENFRVRTLAGC